MYLSEYKGPTLDGMLREGISKEILRLDLRNE